jgi:hypothetical protein
MLNIAPGIGRVGNGVEQMGSRKRSDWKGPRKMFCARFPATVAQKLEEAAGLRGCRVSDLLVAMAAVYLDLSAVETAEAAPHFSNWMNR